MDPLDSQDSLLTDAEMIAAALEDSFRLPSKGNVTTALHEIAQALRSIPRAIRGEQDQAGRERGR